MPAAVPGTLGEELEAIIRRAAQLGIPAWRITTALGLPLPVASGLGDQPPRR